MSAEFGVSENTVRRRLVKAGVLAVAAFGRKPDAAELRSVYESLVAAHGVRQASRHVADRYGVRVETAWRWLIEDGLRESSGRQAAPRPVTGNCPCGDAAVARYKGDDPPLCFRCYMRKYASDPSSPFRRAGRIAVAAVKAGRPCADCGGMFPPYVMDFDHVPERGPKLFNLGNPDRSAEALAEELAKCDIVCANCHRIRTWNRRHAPQRSEGAG